MRRCDRLPSGRRGRATCRAGSGPTAHSTARGRPRRSGSGSTRDRLPNPPGEPLQHRFVADGEIVLRHSIEEARAYHATAKQRLRPAHRSIQAGPPRCPPSRSRRGCSRPCRRRYATDDLEPARPRSWPPTTRGSTAAFAVTVDIVLLAVARVGFSVLLVRRGRPRSRVTGRCRGAFIEQFGTEGGGAARTGGGGGALVLRPDAPGAAAQYGRPIMTPGCGWSPWPT